MEFLFDTANLETITEYGDTYPYTGVTSNPSIVKAEGRIDFFAHFRAVRHIIGAERTLHIQVVGHSVAEILADAAAILHNVDADVFIKIPTTEQGLAAMQALKRDGVNVTATAIYSTIQGFAAIAAGADYLAPYVNRIANLDGDPMAVISALANVIARDGRSTKILGASYANVAQINQSFVAGAHAATVAPALLRRGFTTAPLARAIADFDADWAGVYGETTVSGLQ